MNQVARQPANEVLRKPVNTLAIVPQNQRITTLGRKSFNVMLHIAQGQGIERDTYRAPLSEIVAGLDYGSNDIDLIKKHLRAMVSTIVEWQSPTTGEGSKWTVAPLIAHAEISKERGQNFLSWSYAQPLREELLMPAVFARLSIGMLSQMHTHAGIVLYEICARYKNVGRTSRQHWRWWLPVLTGQPETERLAKTEYRFFKRDTIKPAIAEVCSITDIDIELVEYKDGKTINDLQFNVQPKVQSALPLKTPPEPVDLSIIKRAAELGISEERIDDLVAKHGEEEMKRGLDELAKRLQTAFPAPVRDPLRYLKSLLTEVPPLIEGADAVEVGIKRANDDSMRKQTEVKSAWRDEWLRRKREQVAEAIRQLSADSVRALEQELIAQLVAKNSHPSMVKRLQSNGWDHQVVRHMMIEFYAAATFGEDWDQPTTEDLLDIASEATADPNGNSRAAKRQ